MKTLLMIQGGQAVGKMTVGEEIERLTNLKLFHNHMTVEIANHFYGFGDDLDESKRALQKASFSDLRDRLRLVVFDNVAKSSLPGIIYTGVMVYDSEPVWQIVESYMKTFKDSAASIGHQTKILIVELVCSVEERVKRNVSEHRLNKKSSKRNIKWSQKDLENQILTQRIDSNDEDIRRFKADGFIRIDNTNLSARDTAKMIIEQFNL